MPCGVPMPNAAGAPCRACTRRLRPLLALPPCRVRPGRSTCGLSQRAWSEPLRWRPAAPGGPCGPRPRLWWWQRPRLCQRPLPWRPPWQRQPRRRPLCPRRSLARHPHPHRWHLLSPAAPTSARLTNAAQHLSHPRVNVSGPWPPWWWRLLRRPAPPQPSSPCARAARQLRPPPRPPQRLRHGRHQTPEWHHRPPAPCLRRETCPRPCARSCLRSR